MYSDINENDLTPNSDGSSQTVANNTNINNNDTSDPQDKVDGSETSQPKKPISEARLRANRQNAQKSTGPKTARGKAYSRRNAVKHGLLSKQVLFSDDGKPINEELLELAERLHEKYGEGDVRTDLLVEGLVVEYWRQRQAMVVERHCFRESADFHFGRQGNMPNVQRYFTASQRALLKNLALLDELPPPVSEVEEDEDEGEGETTTPQPEHPPAVLESTSGLTAEQGTAECGSHSEDETASGEGSPPTGEAEEAA
jgi:hypothetical protein